MATRLARLREKVKFDAEIFDSIRDSLAEGGFL